MAEAKNELKAIKEESEFLALKEKMKELYKELPKIHVI